MWWAKQMVLPHVFMIIAQNCYWNSLVIDSSLQLVDQYNEVLPDYFEKDESLELLGEFWAIRSPKFKQIMLDC